METGKNSKLTADAITLMYKKIADKISDYERSKIIENQEVINRLFVNGRNSFFITLKDHKSNHIF